MSRQVSNASNDAPELPEAVAALAADAPGIEWLTQRSGLSMPTGHVPVGDARILHNNRPDPRAECVAGSCRASVRPVSSASAVTRFRMPAQSSANVSSSSYSARTILRRISRGTSPARWWSSPMFRASNRATSASGIFVARSMRSSARRACATNAGASCMAKTLRSVTLVRKAPGPCTNRGVLGLARDVSLRAALTNTVSTSARHAHGGIGSRTTRAMRSTAAPERSA